MVTFADMDWTALLGSGGAIATVATLGGAAIKFLLTHLREERVANLAEQEKQIDKYIEHEQRVMDRVEGIAAKFEVAVREARAENREAMKVMTDMHVRTVETMGTFGQRLGEQAKQIGEQSEVVAELGKTIQELRAEWRAAQARQQKRPGGET